MSMSLYCGFWEMTRQGEVCRLGLASLSDSGGLWAITVVPSPWYLALGGIRVGEYWLGV